MNRTESRTGNGQFFNETTFDEYGETIDLAARESTTIAGNPRLASRANAAGHSWDLSAGMDGAIELARKGWPDGVARVGAMLERIGSVTRSLATKQETSWEVAGDFCDGGLFVTGVPECMGTFTETEAPARVLRIVHNCAASSGVSADAICKRGVFTMALIDALESAGRRVELVIADAVTNSDKSGFYQMSFTAKRAGDAMEVDRLAFLLIHPATARRIIFSLEEHEPPEIRRRYRFTDRGNYGAPKNARIDSDVRVPAMSRFEHARDDQIIEMIKAELKRQGVTFE